MNGLIPIERLSPQPVTAELLALNDITWERGLTLTQEEARELSETRIRALKENDRIEFGTEVMRKIMNRFADSRYLDRGSWADVLNEITYYFYFIKAETEDRISDTALVEEMFIRFELYCRGSVDRFEQKEVERIIRKVNMGKAYDRYYGDEDAMDPADFGRRTPDNLLDDTYSAQTAGEEDYTGGAAEEIARDETAEMDIFDDFPEEDPFAAGYENGEDESLYDEVTDEVLEEDAPAHPLNGAERTVSGNAGSRSAARDYFSLGRLTGRGRKNRSGEDDAASVPGAPQTLELPGGASLSVGEAYGDDFAGFTEDEDAFMASLLGGGNDAEDMDALDAFLDRMAGGNEAGGGDHE